MSKVTKKLQVTIPKAVADAHGISAGSDVFFESAGQAIRVTVNDRKSDDAVDLKWRVELFDRATARQAERNATFASADNGTRSDGTRSHRGWTREELYDRGVSR